MVLDRYIPWLVHHLYNVTIWNDIYVKRSFSRRFRRHNLLPKLQSNGFVHSFTYIVFFRPIKFFMIKIKEDNIYTIIMQEKNIGHCARLKKTNI